MKMIWLACLLLTFSTQAFAQNSIESEKVRLYFDGMSHQVEEDHTTITGNVVAVSDKYTLTADKVDLYHTKDQAVVRIVCTGGVNFKTDEILAVADSAELDQRVKTIYLTGNAKIWQGENYIEGERMEIQYETRELYVAKGSSKRVTVIFNLDNQSVK